MSKQYTPELTDEQETAKIALEIINAIPLGVPLRLVVAALKSVTADFEKLLKKE